MGSEQNPFRGPPDPPRAGKTSQKMQRVGKTSQNLHFSKEALKPIESDAARRELQFGTNFIENGVLYDDLWPRNDLTLCDRIFMDKTSVSPI